MAVDPYRPGKRERVPPRRRKQKRSFWRRNGWAIVRTGVVVGLVAFVCVTTTARVLRPFRLLSTESRETQRLAANLRSLREQNATMERQIRYMKTPRGKAQAARKLGYVKPGEIAIVVPAKAKGQK